jgi:hypothetical protein
MEMIVIAVFVLVAACSTIAGWRHAKRRAAIESIAARAGLQYAEEDPFSCTRVAFGLFRKGDGRGAENVMWRADDDGKPVRVFDFWYYTEHRSDNGGTTRTYERFTCAMALVNGSWPSLTVSREGLLDKFATSLGLPDLDFESEEFNRLFVVRCEDPRFASALIDPGMMELLLSTRGELHFELKGRWLLVASPPIEPRLMPGLLGICDEFLRRIPPVVWELYPSPFVDADGKPLPVEDVPVAAPSDLSEHDDPLEALDHSPLAALGEPGRPEYDLDGHVVAPVVEDPWRETPSADGGPRAPAR